MSAHGDLFNAFAHCAVHIVCIGVASLQLAPICAQVGKDQRAQAFLGMLDNDPVVGKMVDATSYYELEADEYARKGVVRALCAYPRSLQVHIRLDITKLSY